MIHSLSGGDIGRGEFFDFALVEIIDFPYEKNKFWYISKIKGLAVNDVVLAPVREGSFKGKVLRVDKNVSTFSSPVSIKKAKTITKKI